MRFQNITRGFALALVTMTAAAMVAWSVSPTSHSHCTPSVSPTSHSHCTPSVSPSSPDSTSLPDTNDSLPTGRAGESLWVGESLWAGESRDWLPGELRDTDAVHQETRARLRVNLNAQIKLLTRSYGDSIVLRWAPEDYVTWRYLCGKGVNIVRYTEGKQTADTLAKALKPATLEEFRAAYSMDDSLAVMAMGSVYSTNLPSEATTHDVPGSAGSLFEVHEDQQTLLAIGIIASELRRDLADRLAMRFIDTNVKRGVTYQYKIEPAVADTTGKLIIDPCVQEVINEPYKPEPFDINITDSAQAPYGLHLMWDRRNYSCYEIERRDCSLPPGGAGGGLDWVRLNKIPYMIMNPEQNKDEAFYFDNPGKAGHYEYRIFAHDAFGDLTEPSPVHTAYVPDMVPPRPPYIKRIVIDRPNEQDPSAEVWADIYVVKDTIEDDFVGMMPMYYQRKKDSSLPPGGVGGGLGEWRPLVSRDKMMAPTDTVIRVDVTNISTSQMVVAAVDTANNISYSMPQLLRVDDMRPPKAPTGLKAETSLEGTITLTWNPITDDNIDYYEVLFANDSTHEFMTKTKGKLQDTIFVDSVALDANQKYIYYKVRAVDYATNVGELTPMLAVIRPSLVPPSVAHLDSSYVDGKGVFMRWVVGNDQQMAYHHVFRKLQSDKQWTLLRRCDADSVRACRNFIDILDTPEPNSKEDYLYAVESFNYSGIGSGLSLQYHAEYKGEVVFSMPIKLLGDYDRGTGRTTLAWETDRLPKGKDWYFCIWRQGPDDKRFEFLISADAEERSFYDYLLRPGQTAHYYIQIQMEDGRESEPSNVVTIKAPEKK